MNDMRIAKLCPTMNVTLRRLDAMEDLPLSCVRLAVRGIRSTFFRWGWLLLRSTAGELTGLWALRPYDVPLRFSPELVDGFGLATQDAKAKAIPVLGVPCTTWERDAAEALEALGADIEARMTVAPSRETFELDIARETAQRFMLARAQGNRPPLLDVALVPAIANEVPEPTPNGRKRGATK